VNVVLSHPDPLHAQAARDHLLAHGILAAVVDRTDWLGTRSAYDVMLCYGRQREEAKRLLGGEGWQAHASGPATDAGRADLSGLDPAMAPACPACRETLPLDANLQTCPSCGGGVDVPELIALEHGPEALDGCYEGPEPGVAAELIERLDLFCGRCSYRLRGLPRAGVCPECGAEYDKPAIVRGFMGG
jgi:hypothetical protein